MELKIIAKIVLCGDLAVGKTSIRRRYMGESFNISHLTTLGVDFTLSRLIVDNIQLDFQIWDLAAQEGYKDLRKRFYNGAQGALIIFDVTNMTSFTNVSKWIQELYTHNSQKPVPIVLVGNKIDLPHDNTHITEKAIQLVTEIANNGHNYVSDVIFYLTSALTGENITACFESLGNSIIHTWRNVIKPE